MLIVEFNSIQLGNDIHKIVESNPRGFAKRIIKETGISHASFYRLMDAERPVQNVNLLLSVCEVLNLDFASYIVGKRTPSEPVSSKTIEIEFVDMQYVERHLHKGYLNRDFYIGGRHYRWYGNVLTPYGVARIGVLSNG